MPIHSNVMNGPSTAARARKAHSAPGLAPDPSAVTTPQEYIRELRRLKAWSGEPSLRDLQRLTGLPRSTVAEALDFRRNRLPPLDRVLSIVMALATSEVVVADWEDAWKRIQMQKCLAPEPDPRPNHEPESPDGAPPHPGYNVRQRPGTQPRVLFAAALTCAVAVLIAASRPNLRCTCRLRMWRRDCSVHRLG